MATIRGINAQGRLVEHTVDDAAAATARARSTNRALVGYVSDQANRQRCSGITVSGIPVGTDALSLAYILGAADKAGNDPAFTSPFVVSPALTVTLNSMQIISIKDAVQAFINGMFVAEAGANAELQAGSLTSRDQVDAIFAAVPKEF